MAAIEFPDSPLLGDEWTHTDDVTYVCENATGPVWGPKLTEEQLKALNITLNAGTPIDLKVYIPSLHDGIYAGWISENNVNFPAISAFVLYTNLLEIYDITTANPILIKSITVINGIQIEVLNAKIFIASSSTGLIEYNILDNYAATDHSSKLLSSTVNKFSLYDSISYSGYIDLVVADAVGVVQISNYGAIVGEMTGYTSGAEEAAFINNKLMMATNDTKRLITLDYDPLTDDTLLTDPSIVEYSESSVPPVLSGAGWVGHLTRLEDDHIVFATTVPEGLCHLWLDATTQINGLVAHITHEYFSGIMCNNTYLALLANSKTADRSVNNNGLLEVGTVTESAIVTGSDIMAYSGFSAVNYFEQANNAHLDFGSSEDFLIQMHVYRTLAGIRQVIFARGDSDEQPKMTFSVESNDRYSFKIIDNVGGSYTLTAPAGINTWEFVEIKRDGLDMEININGVLRGNTYNNNFSSVSIDGSAKLNIGRDNIVAASADPWSGSISLLRFSAKALSSVDTTRVAEFEKTITNGENRQVLLQDTSSTIKNIDYDENGNILSIITPNAVTKYVNAIAVDSNAIALECISIAGNNEITGSI